MAGQAIADVKCFKKMSCRQEGGISSLKVFFAAFHFDSDFSANSQKQFILTAHQPKQ
jgi:hypothetical protein